MWLLESHAGRGNQEPTFQLLVDCYSWLCVLSWFNWIQWWFLNCKWLRCWCSGGNCRTEIRWTNNFINKFQYWKKNSVKISLCIVMNISQKSPQLGYHAEQNLYMDHTWKQGLACCQPWILLTGGGKHQFKGKHSEPKLLGRQSPRHAHGLRTPMA